MTTTKTKKRPNRYKGDTGPVMDLDDFDDWLNCWADQDVHPRTSERGWREGYMDAVRDIRREFLRVTGRDE